MLQAAAPIGVFDSGLGGLSIFMHLTQRLPFERYVYLADTLHVPYGSRSQNQIRQLTLQAVDWLVLQGCKLIVIACNSASAYGLVEARQRHPTLPIVGLVPALKPAVLQTQTKNVAVLATPATLKGWLLKEVIEKIAKPNGVKVFKYSIASLVPWVELGMPDEHIAVDELNQLLIKLQSHHIDQLVLGCTHYPFFKPYLSKKIQQTSQHHGLWIELIDSGRAIANRVYHLLDEQQLLNLDTVYQPLQFFSTADQPSMQQTVNKLLHQFQPERLVKFFQVNDIDLLKGIE